MKIIKARKQKGNFLLQFAVFAFAVYVVIALVNQQVKISEKSQQLSNLQQQIQTQQIKNDDIKHALSANAEENSEYIESVARNGLNYAKPGERVFVNIAGD